VTSVRELLRHELLRRSVLFAAPILLSTVVGVFSIPVLVSALGAGQWGVLVVLQSAAQLFAILVAFGWGATGPSMTAATPRSDRRQFYLDSLVARSVIFAIALPIAGVAGAVLTAQLWVAFLSAITYMLPGVGAAWYFIGSNRPVALFLLDALPLILGQIVGLLAVSALPTLATYLAVMAAFSIAGAVASAIFVLTRRADGEISWRRRSSLRRLYSAQLGGTATMVSGSLYSTLPPSIVQLVAPAMLPVYAITDRLFKYAIIALGPVLQAVQSWVPEAEGAHTTDRARRTLQLGAVIGLLGGVSIAVLGPLASTILTLGQAPLPWGAAVILGAAFAFESVAQVTGLAGLVALGGVRRLASSSIASAVIGLPLFAIGAGLFGILGATSVLLLVAATTAVYRTVWLLRLARAADEVEDDAR